MRRSSSSDLLTVEVWVSPPSRIAATGLSSSELDTDADARMSSSPSLRMSSTFIRNSGAWTSIEVTAWM